MRGTSTVVARRQSNMLAFPFPMETPQKPVKARKLRTIHIKSLGMFIYDRETREWVPWDLTYNFDKVVGTFNADRYDRLREQMKND